MQLLTTLAALSATVASVQAGSAYVYNHCTENVYLWAVDTERVPGSPTKLAPGGSWSEVYHTPASGGVSIKLSKDPNCDKILQFEYTLTSGQWNQVWYDGSFIDCGESCPWGKHNLYVGASVSSCPQRYCAATDPKCADFYNKPDDDFATLACEPTADTFLHLCLPDSQMPGGSSPPAPPSSPSPAPAPTSSSKAKSYIMEAPVATTFSKAHKTVRSIAERSPEPEILAVHAHARRHLHHRV
jgi:hypothetical protein